MDAVLDDLFGERAERLPRSRPRRGRRCHGAGTRHHGRGPRRARRARLDDRPLGRVGVVHAVALRSARDQYRGHPPDARAGELADQRGGLHSYGQVSTAFISGDHAGEFAEADLDVGQQFHNSYEQSKFESELLVAAADLPTRLMRPSIVVGERVSGWTAAFNVVYWPLRAFSRGLFDVIPADPSAPVDVVPIDYVADAVYALCGDAGTDGQTYHLTAGPQASTMLELCTMASQYFRRPPPRVVTAEEFAKLPPPSVAVQQAFAAGAAYFPYFAMEGSFGGRGHAGATGAGRDQLPTAVGLHRPAAGLCDSRPLGQGQDPARRGGRDAPRRRARGRTAGRLTSWSVPPAGGLGSRFACPRRTRGRRSDDRAARRHRPVSPR